MKETRSAAAGKGSFLPLSFYARTALVLDPPKRSLRALPRIIFKNNIHAKLVNGKALGRNAMEF
jgi:hypothetical protein